MTDIVCVSSACPDDTTPANGWNLTDIHVRTYSGQHKFSRAIARRMTPDSEPKMTRETAFHSQLCRAHPQLRRVQAALAGQLLRQGRADRGILGVPAGRRDHGPVAAAQVRGDRPGLRIAPAIHAHPRRQKLGVGQVVYTAMCYEHGGMIDDGTLLRLGKDNFRWVGGDDFSGEWLRETGHEARPQRPGALVHRPDAQYRGARAEEPRYPQAGRVDLAAAAVDGRARMVPLRGGAHRRFARRAGRRLAHRLYRRARLRNLVPSARRRKGLRRGVAGRPAAWA